MTAATAATPDLREAEAFVSILAPTGHITFQTFDDSPAKRQGLTAQRPASAADTRKLREKLHQLATLNDQGAGVFITVNATDGRGRKVENIKAVRALCIDIDTKIAHKAGVEPLRDPSAFGLQPSLWVESSPGNHHAYWLIDDLAEDFPLIEFKPAQRRIALAFPGGDIKSTDLPHVMRVPGFLHRKVEPFRTHMLAEGPRYSVAELRAWLATLPSIEACASPGPEDDWTNHATPLGWSEDQMRRLLSAVPADVDYTDWCDAGMALHHETSGEGFHLWDEWSAGGGDKYPGTEVLQQKWESFGRYKGTPVRLPTLIRLAKRYEPTVLDGLDRLSTTPANAMRFQPVGEDEFIATFKPLTWIIRRVLPQAGVGVIYGPPGAGKSFMAVDMAQAVAHGVDWAGNRVTGGAVAYVVAEGRQGFPLRLRAYHVHRGTRASGRFHLIPAAPNILDKDDVRDLTASVATIAGLTLIVIDTLAQTTPGADENSSKDMGRALASCRQIHEATGAMVLLVAHPGKDVSRGLRGWSGIKGALDVELLVDRSGEHRAMTVDKMKDGEGENDEYPFQLTPVHLGANSEGEPESSLVVALGQARQRDPTRTPPKPRGDWQLAVYRALVNLLDLNDEVTESEAVTLAVDSTPLTPGKDDRRREQAARALESMVSRGVVLRAGSTVRLP